MRQNPPRSFSATSRSFAPPLLASPLLTSPSWQLFPLPVVPHVLAEYLDNYKLGGNLMQALTMTRDPEDKNTFLFRPTVLVEEVPRVVCVPEKEALCSFLKYFEDIGPNIILVVKLDPYM